jgi:uncharacterized repeat protein (TIGR01451 family)
VPTSPVNTVAPSISGTAKVGLTLTADPGTWTGSPAPTFTYQWQRCDALGANCADIGSATSVNYSSTVADASFTIRVVVTASNGSVDASATSNQVGPVTRSPSMTVQPSISGNAVAGDVLTASPGSWTGYPAPTYSYQWRQCDATFLTCTDIVGETGTTYIVAVGDIGSTIRVAVTATNSAGSAFASSNQTFAVTGVAPANTGLPSISGTTNFGQVLTASTGTWTGAPAPAYSYQWRRCDAAGANCADIASATGSNYTLVSADSDHTIRVVVTGTNGIGNASATSSQTASITPPPFAPINTALPTISGITQVGAALTANAGMFTAYPAATSTYAWLRCDATGNNCSSIGGATGSTYTLVNADLGATIVVQETASNSQGSTPASSAATAAIVLPPAPPANTTLPTISGTTTVGQTLTAAAGAWSGVPAPTLTHQWLRCDTGGGNCVAIAGSVASTYQLASADQSHTIRVAVTGTNASGNSSASSAQTAIVAPAPALPSEISAPSVAGISKLGEILTAQPGTWQGIPTPTITIQWQRCATDTTCEYIAGQSGNSYTLTATDVGATIRIVVTATNIAGTSTATASASGPVLAGKIAATQSTVYATPADSATGIAAPDSVPADGSRFSRIRVELRDVAGNLITGRTADIVAAIDGDATASPARETTTPGIYDIELRSTKVNVATVSISIDGVTLQDRAKIVFVKAIADLDIKLSTNNETPHIGDTVVFNVEVKNLGPNAATGVVVDYKLSDRVTFVSSEATRGQYDPTAGIWTIGTLALGESAVLKVTVKVTK